MHRKNKTLVLPKDNHTPSRTSSVPSVNNTTISATSSKPLPLPDDVTIIWLDAKANLNSDDDRITKIMLGKIHSSVRGFHDVKTCLDFLTENVNTKARVFLVVSGKLSILILPDLKKLTVIDSIFIFCAHPEKYNYLITEYSPHVIGVFSNEEALQSCLQTELNNFHTRAPALNFFAQKQSTTRDLTYDAAAFLWFQLLQKVLTKTKYDTNDMKQMLNYCRQHYAREAQQQKFLAEIDEFERTYTSTNAINWYTRQSFVYQLINRALRTEDIEALHIFRFYISDLCRQLASEHDKFHTQNKKSPILKLYRGCHMMMEELRKLQETKGGMTSINGFASTSLHQWVADQFLLRESRRRTNAEKVLWIIEADTRIDDMIFAYVAPFSQHSEEEEVLFNIGSAFRIDDVIFDDKTDIWLVKATATNEGSDAVSEYMKLIEHDLEETSEKVIFGTLLMDMGNFLTAQRYFEDLIERSDKSHSDFATLYYNLGLTNSFQDELGLAEKNFLQALRYQMLNPTKQRNVVRTLNALGWMHQESGELSKAMSYYEKAKSLCTEKLGSTDLANAQTYTYMGRYYLERQQYSESNNCYKRVLEILHCHLQNQQHQRFGYIFNEMGDLSRKRGDFVQALNLYQQAESIFHERLPQYHPCMAYCWSGMGIVFLYLNDIEEARRYHKKALKSYKHVLPPKHVNISTSEKNLECVNYVYIVDSYLKICCQV